MNRWTLRALVRILGDGRVRRRRANPFLALYRWRYEVALLAVVVGLVRLGQVVHWTAPLTIVLTSIVVVGTWPDARRVARDRCWAVVVQHRLRTAFYELGLTTWAGRAPAIVWTTPCPDGLWVHLICPAGIDVDDLVVVRETLAAACYASDVLVERHARYANIVVLLVVTDVPAR
jgi:hypothetical protein